MVMDPDFRLPPHLRAMGKLLRSLALKKQQRLRDRFINEATRLRQQAQEMERQGDAAGAQKLHQKAQRHEHEAAQLSEDIKKAFVCH